MCKFFLIIIFFFPFCIFADLRFSGNTRWGYKQFESERYINQFGSTGEMINNNAEIELGIFNDELILRQSNRTNRTETWTLSSDNEQISISNRGNQADLTGVYNDNLIGDNSDLVQAVNFWGQAIFCALLFQWGLTIAVIIAIKFSL